MAARSFFLCTWKKVCTVPKRAGTQYPQLWQDTGTNVRRSERAQPPKSGGLDGAHDPAVMSWGSPDMIRGSPHMIRGGSLT